MNGYSFSQEDKRLCSSRIPFLNNAYLSPDAGQVAWVLIVNYASNSGGGFCSAA